MSSVISLYSRLTGILSGRVFEGLALLFTRVALAGVFWRSYTTKVEEGTWFQLSDITYFLFESEYAGVPLPSNIAAPMATYAEFFFPILLVLGLATRFASLSLLIMTLVIQFFVYPDAWWSVHLVWVAMALVLMSRGAGVFSLDAAIAAKVKS
ncbi:DoxX family protein [Altererythrobacter lutimaris]|uniref:DoxX family protein n=1 Tax=Altererythrobacter lutimaris TaxID=2743979 RepID=A0A850HF71_9SPHN|nr:DoxX family protein [Altererythrobacter lutimaris]NVE95826.1 DoxX family protein [Altererythrobacter lutimaris]